MIILRLSQDSNINRCGILLEQLYPYQQKAIRFSDHFVVIKLKSRVMSRIERSNENYKISYPSKMTKNRCRDENDEKSQEGRQK